MKPALGMPDGNAARRHGRVGLDSPLLRLVKGRAERRAIEAGEIDAILDPETGHALLLPEAHRALRNDKDQVRSLLALTADWCWEQDEFHRFVTCTRAGNGEPGPDTGIVLGKTLQDLPFDNMTGTDWQGHQWLLDWRGSFRELELRGTDRDGDLCWFAISGEPTFDRQDQFKGYRGVMRDITQRKQAESLAQKPLRIAGATLHALAVQVYVLDPAGIVILANKSAGVIANGDMGIGAGFAEGANYLDICDRAGGSERDDSRAIAAGIRRVLAGDSPAYHHEYVCGSSASQCRFNLTVTPFTAEGGARIIVTQENITSRKGTQPRSMTGRATATGTRVANRLLAALPAQDYHALLAGLEPVALTHGQVLYETGAPMREVYFPNDSVVSLLTTTEGHAALETGLVGREGMVGIPVALGASVSFNRALVQGSGTAMRMEAGHFRRVFLHSLPLQLELNRYIHARMVQVEQTVACNNFHRLEARLARWLLTTRDRTRSNSFSLTQKFLADMLGVRRVGVTVAARALETRRLISSSRGGIRILDRRGLEAAACPCYRKIKNQRF